MLNNLEVLRLDMYHDDDEPTQGQSRDGILFSIQSVSGNEFANYQS